MSKTLKDLVVFRGDRLFNGAVNIDWFLNDEEKRDEAAKAFVFHGPTYHGVSQQDVGISHGHKLQDTANFALSVVRRCYGLEDQPFNLAIAGYGTGKSHLALTLAMLLSEPDGEVAQDILQGLGSADENIGGQVRALLLEEKKPSLVVAINGMGSFDLTAEFTRQIVHQLKAKEIDSNHIDELRPRFAQAAQLIRMSSKEIADELCEFSKAKIIEDILDSLSEQNEKTYEIVHMFFESQGMVIRAFGGESFKDVIDVVCKEYCGDGKPFEHLLILFDEFGRYTEFASIRSQVAGSGVLQDLFEGIQKNSELASFFGFIQFELNAYVQRVAPEYRNEILRYVTRYQNADRAYLSINLETLIAHLLEIKDQKSAKKLFETLFSLGDSKDIINKLNKWFPHSLNHSLWNNADRFHTVIREGCWPLSPYSTWFFFYLAAVGKHLQERSALALLGDVFSRVKDRNVSLEKSWSLSPVDLWSDTLQQELISSEEAGQQGSITHAYSSVQNRHGTKLSPNLHRVLKAIVLSTKMGLNSDDREDAFDALCEISGLNINDITSSVSQLEEEYNVLEWDNNFKQFEIIGDAVPRTQFLSFLKQKVSENYDEEGKSKLFASRAAESCALLIDLKCDFSEMKGISTKEWRYQSMTTNLTLLGTQIKLAEEQWHNAIAVDEPKGSIIYCYVEQSRNPAIVSSDVRTLVESVSINENSVPGPILVVLLCDEEGHLGQALAEQAVLEDSLTNEDKVRFGNLVNAHLEKIKQLIQSQVEKMILQRRYVCATEKEFSSYRLGRIGTELFDLIYDSTIPFPFDGFSTSRGNAADTCLQLTTELLQGKLDIQTISAKPPRDKNRAVSVLKDSWGIFSKNGDVSPRPAHPIIQELTKEWDDALRRGDQRLEVSDELNRLFGPPYGANIASAGLLLGAFVAPRANKLIIVQNGNEKTIMEWLQDGIFKGKYLDLKALDNTQLVLTGEVSSEWEALLDDWDLAESYVDMTRCLDKAYTLSKRIRVPAASKPRFEYLERSSVEAANEIERFDNSEDEALKKIKIGYDRSDITNISWGAVLLKKIQDEMRSKMPLWTDLEIDEIQPEIERARQAIIQNLPGWLERQAPRNDSPQAVGDFKSKMINLIGGNLKKLDLVEQFKLLEERTSFLIMNAELAAKANQLIRSVSSWMEEHADALRIVRIAEIRGLRQVGKDWSSQLKNIGNVMQLPELNEKRSSLNDFLAELKKAEDEVVGKGTALWNSEIHGIQDVVRIIAEVDLLNSAFEGLETDLEDYKIMKAALYNYRDIYQKLGDENLSLEEFEKKINGYIKETEESFGDEDLPWPPTQTIEAFIVEIKKEREKRGHAWINEVELEAKDLSKMTVAEVSRLRDRVLTSCPMLTEKDDRKSKNILNKLDTRLQKLEVDWLVIKFKEMSAEAKKKFLSIVSDL